MFSAKRFKNINERCKYLEYLFHKLKISLAVENVRLLLTTVSTCTCLYCLSTNAYIFSAVKSPIELTLERDTFPLESVILHEGKEKVHAIQPRPSKKLVVLESCQKVGSDHRLGKHATLHQACMCGRD